MAVSLRNDVVRFYFDIRWYGNIMFYFILIENEGRFELIKVIEK